MWIVAFAYACEPGRGSEPGPAGLGPACWLVLGDTWSSLVHITARRSAGLAEVPERDRLHFHYVDLPAWARRWQRGRRGMRLHYLLWQLTALQAAREAHALVHFELAWHLTFANAWFGSVAPLLKLPLVYGPVGGGAGAPWQLLPSLGAKGASIEVLRGLAQRVGRYLNPLARLSWRRASLILVQNPETERWFPARYRSKDSLLSNVVVESPSGARPGRGAGPPTAVFAGELRPLKGVALAIRAMRHLLGWQLLVFGTGPDEARLRGVARRHGVE